MSATPKQLTIPSPDELRADIKRQTAELRAKRKLLRLAEAAQSAGLPEVAMSMGGTQGKKGAERA
jgi:hypothetical protein